MSIKKIAFALAASTAVLVASPAFADTFTGALSGSDYNPATGHGTFFDIAIPGGAFTDTITFTNPTDALLNNVYFDAVTTGFSSLSATFDGHTLAQAASPVAGFTRYSFSNLSTVAGTNNLVISGTSNGGLISSFYAGNIKFTAVPEPASWMLMIGGLGLAGAALRRRKVTTTLRYA
jgi:hypothetical protein